MAKTKGKKFAGAIACALCAAAALSALGGAEVNRVDADVAPDENGMRVAMTENWASSKQTGTLSVHFEETVFAADEYFAIDMRTYEATLNGTSNLYCPQILFDGAAKATSSFRVANRWGDDYSAEYKNGGYIYLPASMSGIVYVPASLFITAEDNSLSSITLNWSNHGRTMTANYYSLFKASDIGKTMTAENAIFDFNALATDTAGKVTDSKITYNNVNVTKAVSAVGYAAYESRIFTVETPADSFANTYFTANFAETAFASGEYLAIDLKVEQAVIGGGASNNYAFQIKLNGQTMQQPSGVYKQTFGQEFGVYQRGGSGTGFFGNGVWFFMNADLDAILYIPAEKLLAGTSSADAVLQDKIKSVTIDYANGNKGRQTKVAYYGIFKAGAVGETMNEANCLYDFTQAETDGEGTVTDESLTVSRLTAKIREETDSRFTADMKQTNLRAEEAYGLAAGEKRIDVAVENGKPETAQTLVLRLKQNERTTDEGVNGLQVKIGLKFKGYAGVYTLGGGLKSIPALVDGVAAELPVSGGAIALPSGADATVYVPLNGIYQALPQNAEIEKAVLWYTGNDFAIGEFALRADVNGEKFFKQLNVTVAAATENVSVARYVINISAGEGGSVSADRGKYAEGDEVTLRIQADAGYMLHTLTVDGADVTHEVAGGTYVFTASADAAVSAVFMPALSAENFYFGGASIRLKKSQDTTGDGIRFAVLMEKTLYERLTAIGGVSFGTVLLPSDRKPEGEALTVNTPLAKTTDTGGCWQEIEIEGKAYMRSIVYLWGIQEQNYCRGIEVRGYICIGGKYFYTEEAPARSIAYVAQAAYKDTEDQRVKDLVSVYFPRITFDGGEGTGTMETVILQEGFTYVLPACTFQAPAGKTFGGYLIGGKTFAAGDTVTVSGNTTATVIWL